MPSKRNGAVVYATEASVRAVEAQVASLDTQVKGLDTQVKGLDTQVKGLDTQVKGLDTQVKGLDTQVKGLDAKVERLDVRITDVEARLTDKINFVGALVEQVRSDMKVYVEGARSDIDATKARWADAQRALETRILDLEDVVRRGSRSTRAVEKDLGAVRGDIDELRARMNSVRDDLVKWGFGGGELPPVIAQHNARFDEHERRLAAIEARLRS